MVSQIPVSAEVTLYLDQQATPSDAEQLASELQRQHAEEVDTIEVITRDQALSNLRERPAWAEALAVLSSNPLPDAVVVTLQQNPDIAATSAKLSAQWRTLPNVDTVQIDSTWVQRLQAMLDFLGIALWLLALGVAIVVLATVFNTVRLQALTQRDEIAVARLVGATESFVRRPFLYLGALTGLLSCGLAVLIAWSALQPLNATIERLASSYGTELALRLPDILSLVLAGVVVAILGALSALVGDTEYAVLKMSVADFALRVCEWQRDHGRHHLPWQSDRDPYRIWLSEIMLQQTQVTTVIPYFERFLSRFPTVQALAAADQDVVMAHWAGLGYYARARNLHRCAQVLVAEHDGRFPPSSAEIAQLPGIGRSTAAAIAAFSYGERSPIMDGNVKRVFTRYFGIHGYPGLRAVEQRLWALAEEVISTAPPSLDMAAYTQGQMDLGAQVCRRSKPACDVCPLAEGCVAKRLALQQTLPERRPKKTIPEKSCAMLVLHQDGHILLEKQPDQGIWGGLWSLPSFETSDHLAVSCRGKGIELSTENRMAAFVHTFTHFKLHIEPWHVQAPCRTAEPEPGQSWVSFEALDDTAMPTPIRKIVSELPMLRAQLQLRVGL